MDFPTDERVEVFLAKIRESPFDDDNRKVFADWIQENIPGSEELQAAYRGGAKAHLEDFCERVQEHYRPWHRDGYGDGADFFTYEYVVNMGLEMIQTGKRGFRVRSAQQAESMLEDDVEREKFWDALSVITGYHLDADFRIDAYTTCSC
jgi:uncharacterized protein (TIGR02996 family)